MHLVSTPFPGVLLNLHYPSGSWVLSLWCWGSYSGSAVFGVLHQEEYEAHVTGFFLLALGSTWSNILHIANMFLHKLMGCFGMSTHLQEFWKPQSPNWAHLVKDVGSVPCLEDRWHDRKVKIKDKFFTMHKEVLQGGYAQLRHSRQLFLGSLPSVD